jgi:xyloglucan-specific exo-beta-1,4-glucanase
MPNNKSCSLKMKSLQALSLLLAAAHSEAAFSWNNVRLGGGGGFVSGIVFHPKTQGVAYARTDIGGLYKLNSDDSWRAVTDDITQDGTWYVNISVGKRFTPNSI